MALEQSYTSQPAGSPTAANSGAVSGDTKYWELSKLRRCYTDYLFSKRQELDEQIESRRYYHGSQWTTDQMNVMRKRKQPIMTFNRIARKIDGVVGLIEKLRQDPKAFARTPQHEEGADLATATLRYVLDEQAWKEKSPVSAQDGAVDGIGGVEVNLAQGDKGDPEVSLDLVDIDSFFYDPRSYMPDFEDARYLGVGKWVDQDVAEGMFPEAGFDALSGNDFELTNNTDRQLRWFSQEGVKKRIRLVDIWYKHQGTWCWAIFSGNSVLKEGETYLKDEKGKGISKYVMFSGNVDQDGDRYGFVRNMKSAQDGINARQSKMQHILASRRLIISQGAVDDVEKIRQEWARPDGVIMTSRPVQEGVKADDQTFDFAGWEKMLRLNLEEIENFGPNPALIGQGLESQSGRAIALLQQAGMAELGPYILAYRGWKVRLYRAIWNAIQQHWQAERWIRVTDDQQLAQYIAVNQVGIDPQTGQPTIINGLGSLDVDIILDEGPDHINSMQDIYETLSNVLPSIAPVLTPQKAQSIVDILIETSPLPADVKKRFKDEQQAAAQQPPPPDPAVEAEKQKVAIQAQAEQAKQQREMAKGAADMQMKREQHQIEMQAFIEKTNAELEAMRLKCAMECDAEQQRQGAEMQNGQMQMEFDRQKGEQSMQLEREKAAINHETRANESKAKIDEIRIKAELTSKGEAESADKMKPMADAVKELAKALSKPKSIDVKRDAKGNITGATAS